MSFLRASAICAPVVAAAVSLPGCSRADSAAPVATVSFTPSATRVALGTPIELTYRFDVASGAAIAGDYLVFMHVETPDGTRLWGDDHQPPVPTSQWKPGQTVEYTRMRFVPPVAHLGEAVARVGLYNGDARLPLATRDGADAGSASRAYRVGQLQLLPQPDTGAVTFAKGWYNVEFPPADPAVTWQWSQKAATLTFKNPRRDATLLLEFDARPDLMGGRAQQVTLSASDGQTIASWAADGSDRALKRIPLTTAQIGTADVVTMTLAVDRTFVPATAGGGAGDTRELGIRVYHAFVELR
jgi:hypothetical protein